MADSRDAWDFTRTCVGTLKAPTARTRCLPAIHLSNDAVVHTKKEDAKKRKRTADLGVRPAHHRQVLAIIQLTILIFVHWPFGVAPTQSEHRVRFLARKWCRNGGAYQPWRDRTVPARVFDNVALGLFLSFLVLL